MDEDALPLWIYGTLMLGLLIVMSFLRQATASGEIVCIYYGQIVPCETARALEDPSPYAGLANYTLSIRGLEDKNATEETTKSTEINCTGPSIIERTDPSCT